MMNEWSALIEHGVSRLQYRLRVGEIRVFYDVTEDRVEILAVITKAQAEAWLEKEGTRDQEGSAS
jgi:hypothetical protein